VPHGLQFRAQGETPLGSLGAALDMTTVTSVPTICGEDAIHLGDEVWVNNLAPMAGRFGLVDCMPGVVVGFLRDGKDWLVSVKQKGTLALPITGEAWIHHADIRQITLR